MITRICSIIASVGLLLWGFSCARDVNGDLEADPYPVEVRYSFRVRDSFATDTWYYTVFNFTKAPNTGVDAAPYDFISDENRGRNWELYIVYHKDPTFGDQLLTLQRPNIPTLLPTADGPAHSASADFNADEKNDIVVACKTAGALQFIRGVITDPYDPTFFQDPVDIAAGAGPGPIRVFKDELSGDTNPDLVVLYAGDATNGASFKVLTNSGGANFTAGTAQSVPATPIDAAYLDLNGDTFLDLAILTDGTSASDRALRIYLGDGVGNFTAGDVESVGSDPVALATGILVAPSPDIAVADGGAGAAGSVRPYLNTGDGTFDAQETLAVPGPVTGVGIGKLQGQGSDIAVTYLGAGESVNEGYVGMFDGEVTDGNLVLATTPISVNVGTRLYYLALKDTNNDSYDDALLLDGSPDGGGSTLFIQLSQHVRATGETVLHFEWSPETITYGGGDGPARIVFADIDKNGIEDLIIPNTGTGANGNSICLFFGLGLANYTSANIYWTDEPPVELTTQSWYISHFIGPNSFELTLDPGVFYDLAGLPPENFLIDFMTGTTGIDLVSNPNQDGEIKDNLLHPVNVPMTIGTFNDEQNTPLANTDIAPVPAQDIDSWSVEVN